MPTPATVDAKLTLDIVLTADQLSGLSAAQVVSALRKVGKALQASVVKGTTRQLIGPAAGGDFVEDFPAVVIALRKAGSGDEFKTAPQICVPARSKVEFSLKAPAAKAEKVGGFDINALLNGNLPADEEEED